MHPTLVCSRIPVCASLSRQVCRPFCADIVTHPGWFPTSYTLLSCYSTDIVRLKLKEHIHTTSIYTELCFICYKISPLVFFFFLCRYCLLYTSHERLMILNLACFKAFCSSSSVGRAERSVDVVRSSPDGDDGSRARARSPTSLRLPALFLP